MIAQVLSRRVALGVFVIGVGGAAWPAAAARAGVTHEEVERAIRDGVRFLKLRQAPDGSWPGHVGITELAALAVLTAGTPVGDPAVARALERRADPFAVNETYANGLQAMLLATADPVAFHDHIARDAAWLVEAMNKPANVNRGPRQGATVGIGAWSYRLPPTGSGDHSNTQYAVLGLFAAAQAGVPIHPSVWAVARRHWELTQRPDGGWSYNPAGGGSTGSMTTAGVSSLIMTGRMFSDREVLLGNAVENCGRRVIDPALQAGIDWLGANFSVRTNPGMGGHHLYYLYGLERAGRLSGRRYFGGHDWYREGAEVLVHSQRPDGSWTGDGDAIISTSFALLFLAKGRAPVLVNKLAHGPGGDWDNDPDDVRNLVGRVASDWGQLLTWQVVDPESATVEDLLQAPVVFFNGHAAPRFGAETRQKLRQYVESGGFLFADACCFSAAFDQGFRALMGQVFPEPEVALRRLPDEHPVWHTRYALKPGDPPLWGIDYGCRTVVIYSPRDLSCGWNQDERQPDHPLVEKAGRVGQNVIDYATGREPPADKLTVRVATRFEADAPKRGALHVAKLKHGGDWNVAPLAVPNLMSALRRPPLNFDVVLRHKELAPADPNLVFYPLIYIHGRSAVSFSREEMVCLHRHLEPGGGTFFADAACGSPAFDASFRKFVAELLPGHPLEPIAPDDPLYSTQVGFDLSKSELSRAAGGGRGYPQLEGVKLDGHWAVIYSKLDIGCALERPQGIDCRGYTHESALKIAANVVIYSTLP